MTTRRGHLAWLLFLVVVASLSLPAREARACSCAGLEPRDAILQHDAAFVGTLLERRGAGALDLFSDESSFVFAVEEDVKGNLGSEVEVFSPGGGGACGLEVEDRGRVGLFLTLSDRGVWTGSLCSQIEPDVLLRAAQPLPAPSGTGPVRLLVGGSFGEARVLALDEEGRTLAYGYGEGEVYDLDVCPGGRRSVETVAAGRIGSVVVRDVASLAVVGEVALLESKFPSIYEVACLDERGEHLLAIGDAAGAVRVYEVLDGVAKEVFSGRGRSWGTTIEGDVPYVVLSGRRFGRVDIHTGGFELIARLPEHTDGARLSPDGRWVATVRYGGGRPGEPPSDIVVVSTRDGSIETRPLVFWNDGGRVHWLAEDRLLFLPIGEDVERIAIYEVPTLRELVGAGDWYAGEAVIKDDVVFGLDFRGLSRVRLGTDEVASILRPFDGPAYALDFVPGSILADPSPAPVTATPSPVAGPRTVSSSIGGWLGLAVGTLTAGVLLLASVRRGGRGRPIV